MIYDDDSVRILGRFYSCQALGLDWPPPKDIYVSFVSSVITGVFLVEHPATIHFYRTSFSEINDKDRETMSNVFRAADYGES